MKHITKQSIGIDCAKNDFAVTYSRCDSEMNLEHVSSRVFLNTNKGFEDFLKWQDKRSDSNVFLPFVMEATGVYHERLACFLSDSGKFVSVIFPNRAKAFSKTLVVKTVNDKESSKALATMGIEKKMDQWKKPDPTFNRIKQLTREREQWQKHNTQAKNQLHAENAGAWINKKTIARLTKQILFLNKLIQEIEQELKAVLNQNKELKEKVDKVITIPGVGLITALTVIGETNGFKSMKNKRQLVSYSGYDIVEKSSGTSVRSTPRMSKKGNRHIRKALHLPSLSSIRHNSDSKDLFARIVAKHGIKMKAVVAVQRKTLVLIYTLWKNNQVFDPQYLENKNRVD